MALYHDRLRTVPCARRQYMSKVAGFDENASAWIGICPCIDRWAGAACIRQFKAEVSRRWRYSRA